MLSISILLGGWVRHWMGSSPRRTKAAKIDRLDSTAHSSAVGWEEPRSGDKFVWNEFGRSQAGPERKREVGIMDDANNPAVPVR
ncbi:MAG: hypothetical protein EPN36_11625 [Rhodanobacteraceae bacterium]|nr:MAG: hypothetical protein EPN36_11625 [Rhodanobacteraceae bacterium]